jgi:hypothetical protein
LSATHLVDLSLNNIPHSGYFSPEAMVTALSTTTSLESLELEFQSPLSRPDRASRRPPLTRSVLPVLSYFSFKGVSEYLDDLVARIDAPRLNFLNVTYFNQILFGTRQVIQFIARTPTLNALKRASVAFKRGAASVKLFSHTPGDGGLKVSIPCEVLDWQISSLEQVCTWCLPPLSILEDLYISDEPYCAPSDGTYNTLWLELFHPFNAVKNLYIYTYLNQGSIFEGIEDALAVGAATEVLPALQNIFLAGVWHSRRVPGGIGRFVATRQVTGHRIAVSTWNGLVSDRRLDKPEVLKVNS